MRIGIYGGTFNPPHLGHLTAAKTAFELLSLDKLLLIPARVPPHKNLPDGSATAAQRLQMTRLAGDAIGVATEVLELEIARKGKSFTSDTLRELREIYPTDELWLLMGTDMFLTFGAWHEPETILSLAGIAAFGRTEKNTEELFARQRENLTKSYPTARI
ncbi:MAG: nicotinate-nicotinamide nucleotide adenylyltransferase, partial [Ruthenibacterium sp.]